MATRFLDLKTNKASSQVSFGFLLSALLSTVAINLFVEIGFFYFLSLLFAWLVCWFLTSGNAVESRRKLIFTFTYAKLTPHFKDQQALGKEFESVPNLRGVLIQTDKYVQKKDISDELEDWEE